MKIKKWYVYWIVATAAGMVVFFVAHEVGKTFGEQAQRAYESSQKDE